MISSSDLSMLVLYRNCKPVRSCRNLPLCKLQQVFIIVAIIRTSVFCTLEDPPLCIHGSRTRNILLVCPVASQISSRIVPPFTVSKYPLRLSTAPVKEPFCPNNSESITLSVTTQFTAIKGLCLRADNA